MQEKSNQPQMKKQGAQRKWCGYCKTTSHAKEECCKLQARSKKETQSSSASEEASTEGRELQSNASTASRRETLLLIVLVR